MNKVFRSLVWSGIVAVGLAGCGDDVTISEPPPPPPVVPQVRSVTVTPDGAAVGAGGSIQMSANVTADAGATVTVTWSSSDLTRATVNGTGLVTIPAAAAPGAVSIKATATAGTSVASGAATLNVVGTTVTGVTVVPATASLTAGTANNPPQSLTATAVVAGTNNPPQSVTWTSLDQTIATVSAAGVVTANSSAKNGTVNIQACSTIDTTKCGFLALTVGVPSPALVQIQAVTFNNGTTNVPVNLQNVFGQIEIALNIDNGDRVITRVDALIGGQVVASQQFSAASKPQAAPALSPTVVILSTNTAQLRKNGGIFVPVVFNGNSAITANLYVLGSAAPLASNAIPVVMNNPDAIVAAPTATLLATNQTPSVTVGGNTFFTGTLTVSGLNYIAFGKAVPVSVTVGSTTCGPSANLIPTSASATGGIALTGVFDCVGFQGPVSLTTPILVTYATGAVGPDGTPLVAPTGISTVGTAFQIPIDAAGTTESRWNMISPCIEETSAAAKGAKAAKGPQAGTLSCPAILGPVFIDNLGPVITLFTVAFNDDFDQSWINATYLFAQDLVATDLGGSGLAVGSPIAHVWDQTALVCTATVVTSGADFAETLTNTAAGGAQQICALAADALGNVTTSGPSNLFGIDKGAPTVRLAGSTSATPTLAPFTAASVSSVPNTTIYGNAGLGSPFPATFGVFPTTDRWGLEGLDTRSGFNQNVIGVVTGLPVVGFPALQVLSKLTTTGYAQILTCIASDMLPAVAPDDWTMGTVLSDQYVRTTALDPLDCGQGSAYYRYAGSVTDRAGNSSGTVDRNYVRDDVAAPVAAGILPQVPINAGSPAQFLVLASDDVEVIGAQVFITQPIPTGGNGLLYAPSLGLGVRWDAILTQTVSSTTSIPNFLFRVDQSCNGAASPYASCPAPTPAALTFAPLTTNPADYPTGLASLPTQVSSRFFDPAEQFSSTSTNPLSPNMFNPSTGASQPWSTADIISWSASLVGGNVVAIHQASTSIVLPFFSAVSLWRLDLANQWVFCGDFPNNPGSGPAFNPNLTDNGTTRFWNYTLPQPTTGSCTGSTFAPATTGYRVMGISGPAGLFTPSF